MTSSPLAESQASCVAKLQLHPIKSFLFIHTLARAKQIGPGGGRTRGSGLASGMEPALCSAAVRLDLLYPLFEFLIS